MRYAVRLIRDRNPEAHAMKQPCVYITASRRNGTLYVGMTSNIAERVRQHKDGAADGFTRRYGVRTLVWYESHQSINRWKRQLRERKR